MNKLLALLALLALTLLTPLCFAKPVVGEKAPAFTLTDTYGVAHSLSEFAGKTVVLEWTNDQCPFVQKHYNSGNMQGLQKQYTEDGVIWLSIISSAAGKQGYVTAEDANTLTKERNASPSYVLFDESGDVGRLYDARTTPHMYIIDGDGKLQYNGAIDSIKSADKADIPKATNYVSQALTELKSGSVISNPLTKPYGCSIKY